MGGTEFERGNSIAVDLNGNVYTTGLFGGMDADFDPGPDIFILPNSGTYKTFVSKLDNNGNFVWAKSINSGIYNYGNAYRCKFKWRDLYNRNISWHY
ncbi:MAG: SBBP repeat-containing protein [Anaerolineales bacterium]|nr:SBBP repeat-containing protein [Anaerolineales bacterium]